MFHCYVGWLDCICHWEKENFQTSGLVPPICSPFDGEMVAMLTPKRQICKQHLRCFPLRSFRMGEYKHHRFLWCYKILKYRIDASFLRTHRPNFQQSLSKTPLATFLTSIDGSIEGDMIMLKSRFHHFFEKAQGLLPSMAFRTSMNGSIVSHQPCIQFPYTDKLEAFQCYLPFTSFWTSTDNSAATHNVRHDILRKHHHKEIQGKIPVAKLFACTADSIVTNDVWTWHRRKET